MPPAKQEVTEKELSSGESLAAHAAVIEHVDSVLTVACQEARAGNTSKACQHVELAQKATREYPREN